MSLFTLINMPLLVHSHDKIIGKNQIQISGFFYEECCQGGSVILETSSFSENLNLWKYTLEEAAVNLSDKSFNKSNIWAQISGGRFIYKVYTVWENNIIHQLLELLMFDHDNEWFNVFVARIDLVKYNS